MADDKNKLSMAAADFLEKNGYVMDMEATRVARTQLVRKSTTEMTVFYNASTRTYAYTETDGKSYVALSKATWNPVSNMLHVGSGGKIGDAQQKTADELADRMRLIAADNGILLSAATRQKTKLQS